MSTYTTSEMIRDQLVCVAVANGNVLDDLKVEIHLLPSSATGELYNPINVLTSSELLFACLFISSKF